MPWRDRGLWHLCVTRPDVPAMVDHIVDHGGALLTEPYQFVPGRPWTLAYTTDPWGTVVEVMSHTYAEAFSLASARAIDPGHIRVARNALARRRLAGGHRWRVSILGHR